METGVKQEATERFQDLRRPEADGVRRAAEVSELSGLIQELDRQEVNAAAEARDLK